MEDDDNLAEYLAARSLSHRGRQGKNLYEAIMDVSAFTLSFTSVFPLFFVLLLFRRVRKPSQTHTSTHHNTCRPWDVYDPVSLPAGQHVLLVWIYARRERRVFH